VVGQVDFVVVPAAERGAVAGEVLRPGDDPILLPVVGALKAADLGGRDGGTEEGVLAGALDDPAPARIPGDVDHRREGPVEADRAGLPGRDRLAPLDRLEVPGGGHRDRDGEDGAQAVDDVEAEQRRDAQAVALDREPLEPVDVGGIGLEQQRPDAPAAERLLHRAGLLLTVDPQRRLVRRPRGEAEVEVLGQLPRLLLGGHAAQQLVGSRPDIGADITGVGTVPHPGPGLLWLVAHERTPFLRRVVGRPWGGRRRDQLTGSGRDGDWTGRGRSAPLINVARARTTATANSARSTVTF
jgi:hypothetical protein